MSNINLFTIVTIHTVKGECLYQDFCNHSLHIFHNVRVIHVLLLKFFKRNVQLIDKSLSFNQKLCAQIGANRQKEIPWEAGILAILRICFYTSMKNSLKKQTVSLLLNSEELKSLDQVKPQNPAILPLRRVIRVKYA